MLKKAKIALIVLLVALVLFLVSIALINGIVVWGTDGRIISLAEASQLSDVDCIIVLGCGLKYDGTPSAMLSDRIDVGVALYKVGASDTILASGDHGQANYNEVGAIARAAVAKGVPESDIILDHAGFSTYDSIYRAKHIFGAKKVIIVTQEYHLHRALYLAKQMGLDAYGVSADLREYSGQDYRDTREFLARIKDFFKVIYKPKPSYVGTGVPYITEN